MWLQVVGACLTRMSCTLSFPPRSCLKFSDDNVRRFAAACLRDIVRHSPALAASVADAPGALDALSAYAASSTAIQALPALTAFGFIAEHSAELAGRVAAAPGALAALQSALQCGDDHSQAAAAWALGRIGGHSPALSAQVANNLLRLCTLATSPAAADASSTTTSSADLQQKCMRAATAILGQLEDVSQLSGLVTQTGMAAVLLELVLGRCSMVMAKQPASRAQFATSGALAHLTACQEGLPADSPSAQHIATCLRLFPEVSGWMGGCVGGWWQCKQVGPAFKGATGMPIAHHVLAVTQQGPGRPGCTEWQLMILDMHISTPAHPTGAGAPLQRCICNKAAGRTECRRAGRRRHPCCPSAHGPSEPTAHASPACRARQGGG